MIWVGDGEMKNEVLSKANEMQELPREKLLVLGEERKSSILETEGSYETEKER